MLKRCITVLAACLAVPLTVAPPLAFAAPDINASSKNVVVKRGERVGNVSVFTGDVIIRGVVTGDISVLSGDVRLGKGSRVGGDINVAKGDVHLARKALVRGDVQVAIGDVVARRRALVMGDVSVVSGEITAPHGTIRGGRNAGNINVDIDWPNVDFGYSSLGEWLALTVFSLFLSLLLAALFPGLLRALGRRTSVEPWLSPLIGLTSLVWGPLSIVLLIVTVIGLLALPFWLVALVLAWIVGATGVSYLVGDLLIRRANKGRGYVVIATGIGVAILRVLDLIPIIGGIIVFLAALAGLGALTLLVFGQKVDEQPQTLAG